MLPTMPKAISRTSTTTTVLAVDMTDSFELSGCPLTNSREQVALYGVLLDLLVDPLRVLGQSAFDPAWVFEDGFGCPRRVAIDRGGEPGANAVPDPVADFFRINRTPIGHRRQRA